MEEGTVLFAPDRGGWACFFTHLLQWRVGTGRKDSNGQVPPKVQSSVFCKIPSVSFGRLSLFFEFLQDSLKIFLLDLQETEPECIPP